MISFVPLFQHSFWKGGKYGQLLLFYNHIAACKKLADHWSSIEAGRQAAAENMLSFYPLKFNLAFQDYFCLFPSHFDRH